MSSSSDELPVYDAKQTHKTQDTNITYIDTGTLEISKIFGLLLRR